MQKLQNLNLQVICAPGMHLCISGVLRNPAKTFILFPFTPLAGQRKFLLWLKKVGSISFGISSTVVQPAGSALGKLKDPKCLCGSCLCFSLPAVSRGKKRAFLPEDTNTAWCKRRSLTLSNSSLLLNDTGNSRAQMQS